ADGIELVWLGAGSTRSRAKTKPHARDVAAAATREKILKTADTLYSRHGYFAVTHRDIAAAASLSTGAIFGHFADKPALYAALRGHPPLSAEDGKVLYDALSAALPVLTEAGLEPEYAGAVEQLARSFAVVTEKLKSPPVDTE
ncbi:MAG: TetR/AcrR family transcriptional regulator, partial [Brevundimonas sp.]